MNVVITGSGRSSRSKPRRRRRPSNEWCSTGLLDLAFEAIGVLTAAQMEVVAHAYVGGERSDRDGPTHRGARHRNAGKAREFGRLLADAFEVEPLPARSSMPEETGSTFRENALLKAQAGVRGARGAAAPYSPTTPVWR